MLLIMVSSWALGTGISIQQKALLSPKAESAARKKGRNSCLCFPAKKKKYREENESQIINIITRISAVGCQGKMKVEWLAWDE